MRRASGGTKQLAPAQYLTAGVAACYRGYRLYEGEETRRRVRAWVNFYKRYRDILNSDLVNNHLNNKGVNHCLKVDNSSNNREVSL